MIDGVTYRILKAHAPLFRTLCIGRPEAHWSTGVRQNRGIELVRRLSTQVTILDLYGDCDIRHNLNLKAHFQWFDTIFDCGTLDHIANIGEALSTYARHVSLGGHLVLHTVHNNYARHGFHQPTPQFLHQFFRANGFKTRIWSYHPVPWLPVREIGYDTRQGWTFDLPRLQVLVATRTKPTPTTHITWPNQEFFAEAPARPSWLRAKLRKLAMRMPIFYPGLKV